MVDYEYRVMVFARHVTREEARRVLAEAAEHGDWELRRVRVYVGGARRAWLRRPIIRVPRALVEAARA